MSSRIVSQEIANYEIEEMSKYAQTFVESPPTTKQHLISVN